MPKRVRSPLPIDILTLLGTFVGDDYHYLAFKLTPKGFLSHHRIIMQSHDNPCRKAEWFNYLRKEDGRPRTLHVTYLTSWFGRPWDGMVRVRERYNYETDDEYIRATRHYIKLGIRPISVSQLNKNEL